MATENLNITVTAQDLASGSLSRLKNLFVIDLVGAARLATTAFKSIFSTLVESEQAINGLNTAIEINGRLGSDASAKLQEYAKVIQSVTVFSDEQVISVQSLFAQLTNLSAQGIDKATRATVGLSATLGIDLDSAARKVLLAIQGKTAGLEKYIGTVKESLPPQEKIIAILNNMGKSFKRAEEAAKTTTGQMSQLKNSFSELIETFDKSFGVTNFLTEAFKGGKMALEDFTKWIENNKMAQSDANSIIESTVGNYDELIKKYQETAEVREKTSTALFTSNDQNIKSEEELAAEAKKAEEVKSNARKEGTQAAIGQLSQLTAFQSSNSETLKTISKAAAIAQILIDTQQAASSIFKGVMASQFFMGLGALPFAIAGAAAVTAIGAARISQIQGLQEGGLVRARQGGTPVLLGEGGSSEAVIPLSDRRAQREIGGFGGGIIQIKLNLDGRELASTMIDLKRRGALQGRL